MFWKIFKDYCILDLIFLYNIEVWFLEMWLLREPACVRICFEVCSAITFMQLDGQYEQMDIKRSDYIKEPKQCSGYCALDNIRYRCSGIDPVFLPPDYDAAIHTTNTWSFSFSYFSFPPWRYICCAHFPWSFFEGRCL